MNFDGKGDHYVLIEAKNPQEVTWEAVADAVKLSITKSEAGENGFVKRWRLYSLEERLKDWSLEVYQYNDEGPVTAIVMQPAADAAGPHLQPTGVYIEWSSPTRVHSIAVVATKGIADKADFFKNSGLESNKLTLRKAANPNDKVSGRVRWKIQMKAGRFKRPFGQFDYIEDSETRTLYLREF